MPLRLLAVVRMGSMGFWLELKRRHVYRVAVAYAIVGWLLIQVATQVFPFFQLPDWSVRLIVLAILIGFPIALVLAWAFDVSPAGGLRRINSDGELVLHDRRHGMVVVAIIGLLVAALAGGGYWWWYQTPAAVQGMAIASPGGPDAAQRNPGNNTLDFVAAATASGLRAKATAAARIPAQSIAVLPFENLSADKDNAYFAEGMQDLILTKLADIGDLKVISRTSTEKYKSYPDDLKTIARQLGVATILEGSVQKAGNQVLINVQLIDASTDAHIWAESYTRTLDNIFGVEGEVAQKVATALDARLTARETAAVGKLPTHDPRAYDDFLRARYFENEAYQGAFSEYLPRAIAAYEQAVAEDPGFALAWAELANARENARYWGVDHSKANLVAAREATKRALALDPESADAHLAMAGLERFLYRDFAKARDQDLRAVASRPNDPDAFNDLSINDAHLGDLAASLAAIRRTITLDPKNFFPQFDLGLFLAAGGHYARARASLEKALALNPQSAISYVLLGRVEVLQDGDVEAATKLMDNMTPGTPVNANVVALRVELLLYRRDFASVRKLAGEYADKFETGPAAVTLAMSRANIEWLAGNKDTAQTLYRVAVRLITAPGMDLGSDEHMALGLANARLGQAAAAMKESGIAGSIDRHSHDVGYVEAGRIANLAKIRLALGDDSGAIDDVARCLARNDCGLDLSPAQLRVDPTWDPIRHDPRFHALLVKYADSTPSAAASTAAAAPG